MGNKNSKKKKIVTDIAISANPDYSKPKLSFNVNKTKKIYVIWRSEKNKIDLKSLSVGCSIRLIAKDESKTQFFRISFPKSRLRFLTHISSMNCAFKPDSYQSPAKYIVQFLQDDKIFAEQEFSLTGKKKEGLCELKIGKKFVDRKIQEESTEFDVAKDKAVFAHFDSDKVHFGQALICWCVGPKDLSKLCKAGKEVISMRIPVPMFSYVNARLKFKENFPPGEWVLKIFAEQKGGEKKIVAEKPFTVVNEKFKDEDDNEEKLKDIGKSHQKTHDKSVHDLEKKTVDLGGSIEDLRKKFEKFDTNKDGVLDKSELEVFLEEDLLGLDDETCKKTVDKVFKEIDKDGNGTIEFEEFVAYCLKKELGSDEEKKVDGIKGEQKKEEGEKEEKKEVIEVKEEEKKEELKKEEEEPKKEEEKKEEEPKEEEPKEEEPKEEEPKEEEEKKEEEPKEEEEKKEEEEVKEEEEEEKTE